MNYSRSIQCKLQLLHTAVCVKEGRLRHSAKFCWLFAWNILPFLDESSFITWRMTNVACLRLGTQAFSSAIDECSRVIIVFEDTRCVDCHSKQLHTTFFSEKTKKVSHFVTELRDVKLLVPFGERSVATYLLRTIVLLMSVTCDSYIQSWRRGMDL